MYVDLICHSPNIHMPIDTPTLRACLSTPPSALYQRIGTPTIQAVSMSLSTGSPGFLMPPTPPPTTYSICQAPPLDPGSLQPSPPPRTPVMAGRIRVGDAAFPPRPFVISPDVPCVGSGPAPSPASYVMHPPATLPAARQLPNGFASHQLFLNAVGVGGTNVLLPTGLCLVLPSVSHMIVINYYIAE